VIAAIARQPGKIGEPEDPREHKEGATGRGGKGLTSVELNPGWSLTSVEINPGVESYKFFGILVQMVE
jgi:hypothetical protein